MREKRVGEIKMRLLRLREELLMELRSKNETAARLIDEGVPDIGDMSLTDDLKELLHILGDSKREEILRIDEAIERLNDGSYGTCQNCGQPIDIARLEIRPFARFCLACKNDLEKQERLKEGPGRGSL